LIPLQTEKRIGSPLAAIDPGSTHGTIAKGENRGNMRVLPTSRTDWQTLIGNSMAAAGLGFAFVSAKNAP
jgi:hypothetical protein